jgi:O-antigen/teichoic acid export membrane protein
VKILSFVQRLRLHPFPVDTVEGRAAERYRRAMLSMLANGASRALSMLSMVLTIRWTVPYLGTERFGAWMAIASFAALLGFLDLGIGNSLTNRIAHVSNSGDSRTISKIVSGGLGLLLIVAVLLAPILATAASLLPWSSLIKTQSALLTKEVATTAGVFGVLFAITILTNGVARIFHGLQQGYEVHIAAMVGSLIGLTGLAFAVRIQAGLPVLLLCSMGGSILGNIALWIVLGLRGQFKTTNWNSNIRAEVPSLLRSGAFFLASDWHNGRLGCR